MCNPNPVAALADDIASHVRDRERDLIERLRDTLGEIVNLRLAEIWDDNERARVKEKKQEAHAAIEAADAWLAEPVRIETKE